MTRSSGQKYPRALVIAALLAACAAAADAQARELVWRSAPLVGDPSSARIDGDPVTIRIERYDAAGRLVLLSLAQPSNESADAGGAVAEPPELRATAFAYDASGFLSAIVHQGQDASQGSAIYIRRDSEGRPLEARAQASGSLAWIASYSYSGSFDSALVVYRDQAGAPLAADELGFGAGASDELAVTAVRLLPGGAIAGEAWASSDARGSLSGYLALAPLSEASAEASAENSAEAGSEDASDGKAEGRQLPTLGFLSFPRWPGEEPWREAGPELPAPPFAAPTPASPGRADFLYDAEGRLVLARLFDAADAIVEEARYSYDARGFLARELRSRYAASASGEPASGELRVYRYPEGSAEGWSRRDVFIIPGYIEGVSEDWELLPLERQTRAAR